MRVIPQDRLILAPYLDDSNHYVVANKLASLHQPLGLLAYRGLRGNGRTKHVAR